MIDYTPRCGHDRFELRIHTYVNGVRQYKLQCQTCGQRGGAIPKSHDMILDLWGTDPPEVDLQLQERYWEAENQRRREEYETQRNERRGTWWSWYTTYLESEKWRRKRAKVLSRDKWICQARLDGCQTKAVNVHHLTYDHVGEEPLFDLIAVCARCHDRITEMDREKRAS